ncbi:sensor histidine kinase [Nonomuraea africana]|uniref:histidine kinase n=1 Tax=Nonomuraea africana TaxID=46171 RepID=A0ABR9KNV0_9ACTN|nr:sensor histidine kinase [Nonomuraea africana]MBE1563695.1 signal transduction histidine kinase [Nonomuraea africana]
MKVTIGMVAVIAAGCVLAVLVRPEASPNVLDVALPLIICGALFLRRRNPVAVLLVVMIACAVYYPFAGYDGPVMLAALLALYTAADLGHLAAAGTVAAALLLGMGMGETGEVRHVDDGLFLMIAGWLAAAVAAGGVTRNRRAYLQEVERRAAEAEHTKETEAKRRATEERLRIARELHDVLGHNISMINVQAGAALHGIKKRPEEAEAALQAIKETSKETLRELRATLGVLRQVDEGAPTSPTASLGRLDEVVRRSGLTVDSDIDVGEPPVEVDLAAARIIQEALTNVSRHSAAGRARLSVAEISGKMVITVEDDGPSVVFPGGSGYGVQGMKERAMALGGTLEAGPRPEGGYRVVAELPL